MLDIIFGLGIRKPKNKTNKDGDRAKIQLKVS